MNEKLLKFAMAVMALLSMGALLANTIKGDSWFLSLLSLLMSLLLCIYFIPTVIASKRQHPQKIAIMLVNIFLGWTFLGWVVALVWSFVEEKPRNIAQPDKVCLKCGSIVEAHTAFCSRCGNDLLNQCVNKTE